MMNLYRQLRDTGNLGRYVRLVLSRHAQAIVYVVLALVVIFALYTTTQTSLDRERDAQVRACERVQLLRDQSNGTNFLIFNTFQQVADQQQAVIDSGNLKGIALKQAKQSRDRAQRVVDTTVVTGPTSCVASVDSPETYKAPAPEFIAKNTKRVQIARKRSQAIIDKAKTGTPLFGG